MHIYDAALPQYKNGVPHWCTEIFGEVYKDSNTMQDVYNNKDAGNEHDDEDVAKQWGKRAASGVSLKTSVKKHEDAPDSVHLKAKLTKLHDNIDNDNVHHFYADSSSESSDEAEDKAKPAKKIKSGGAEGGDKPPKKLAGMKRSSSSAGLAFPGGMSKEAKKQRTDIDASMLVLTDGDQILRKATTSALPMMNTVQIERQINKVKARMTEALQESYSYGYDCSALDANAHEGMTCQERLMKQKLELFEFTPFVRVLGDEKGRGTELIHELTKLKCKGLAAHELIVMQLSLQREISWLSLSPMLWKSGFAYPPNFPVSSYNFSSLRS
jgi:hypothetical protein